MTAEGRTGIMDSWIERNAVPVIVGVGLAGFIYVVSEDIKSGMGGLTAEMDDLAVEMDGLADEIDDLKDGLDVNLVAFNTHAEKVEGDLTRLVESESVRSKASSGNAGAVVGSMLRAAAGVATGEPTAALSGIASLIAPFVSYASSLFPGLGDDSDIDTDVSYEDPYPDELDDDDIYMDDAWNP